jgi:putative N6-adenine-specific DNA methylase
MDIARRNIRRAGLSNMISLKKEDILEGEKKEDKGLIIMNPPYGERLESEAKVMQLYEDVGTRLKHHYEGWDAWIISSSMEALKFVGLKTSRKIKVFNGALECRFNKYELYKGSRKGTGGSVVPETEESVAPETEVPGDQKTEESGEQKTEKSGDQ